MPDAKPKLANFPERDLTVVLGPNINQVALKHLGRFPIGTYEMSFAQQEKGQHTADLAKSALHTLLKGSGTTIQTEASRDYVAIYHATNAECAWKLWVTPPYELTQASHVVWVKYSEPGKVGVAFRLATGFTADEIFAVLKTAQKNVEALNPGDPFVLKGNPAPRFQKKAVAEAAVPVTEAAPANESAPT